MARYIPSVIMFWSIMSEQYVTLSHSVYMFIITHNMEIPKEEIDSYPNFYWGCVSANTVQGRGSLRTCGSRGYRDMADNNRYRSGGGQGQIFGTGPCTDLISLRLSCLSTGLYGRVSWPPSKTRKISLVVRDWSLFMTWGGSGSNGFFREIFSLPSQRTA